MEGQPGALELLDVTGAKRALTLSPTTPTLDPVLTPHYEDGATGKRAKFESDREGTPHMGSNSTAGSVYVKLENITRPTPPPPPPATTVNNPVAICDLFPVLDTDVLVPGIPSLSHFPPRLSLALKVHPDIEKTAPDAYKEMRILYLKHLDSPRNTKCCGHFHSVTSTTHRGSLLSISGKQSRIPSSWVLRARNSLEIYPPTYMTCVGTKEHTTRNNFAVTPGTMLWTKE